MENYRMLYYDAHNPACRLYQTRIPRNVPPRGCVVLFFGGGWITGTPAQFHMQALYLAAHGWDVVLPAYRLCTRKNALTPLDCYRDTEKGIHALVEGADGFRADPHRLVLGGASAGGHLALCNAILNKTIRPAALVLFNPVVDVTETGYRIGTPRFGGHAEALSPIHLLQEALPPTLLLHGKADTIVPVQNIRDFAEKAQRLGTDLRLRLYPGRGHGFFNHPSFRADCQLADYETALGETARFLSEIL